MHSNSLLDLIMMDVGEHYFLPQPLPPIECSPHLSVIRSPSPTISQSPLVRTFWATHDSAVWQFGQWITHYQWIEVTAADSVHIKWDSFQDTITTVCHHLFPAEMLKMHLSNIPWVTPHQVTLAAAH